MQLFSRLIVILSAFAMTACVTTSDPLPSWNDGQTKTNIVTFVKQVTDKNSPNFVPAAERIATFDNDGTLWSEQPYYFQLAFVFYQIKNMADKHPEWKTTEPYKSVLANDIKGVMSSGEKGLMQLLAASHANMTASEFAQAVTDWSMTDTHPISGKPYTSMVYQPMLELLTYLRANDFKTFIVSGGGIEFMRAFTEDVYGIPPEQVIGSSLESHFEMRDGVPTIIKDAKLRFNDDKEAKPIGIYRHIGRRPILAAGNSDGDVAMLQYTTINPSKEDTSLRLGLMVHHTDEKHEWAYDRDSKIGKFDKGIEEAAKQGWTMIDMKNDWKVIYPTVK
ncbi:HAD family hydrolase [Colwellia sp. E2M01]|uniref:HAD family hydrolase n=1 Tax=Colwellia sp. E2M01 TaxID=2841561 RepID=UPI001C0818C3|nr:HAD family hydrolase [Colwellia sp. E2M01]MBU2869586.1 haloacid dehalogenase-like hydrolase [Colwellia sp. E2M01]